MDTALNLIAILILNFVVYHRTIRFDKVVDDRAHSNAIRDGYYDRKEPLHRWIKDRLYGVGTFAYKDKQGKWKINLKVEHSFQIFLHALACCLMYLAFKPLSNEVVAFFAACLYSVNYVNNQTSIWMNGRRYLVNVILVLLMLCLGKWGLILYPATFLFQVNAIFAPVMYGWLALLLFPVCFVFGWKNIKEKIQIRLKRMSDSDQRSFQPKRFSVILKLYGMYFFNMIVPRRSMMIYPDFLFWGLTKEGNTDAYKWDYRSTLGILALLATLLAGVCLKGQLIWLWVFMALSILQWCGIIAVVQIFSDRYCSLGNAFMMFFVSYFAYTYLTPYYLLVMAALLTYYLTQLQVTMMMYQDIWSYSDHHIHFDPAGVKCREFKATRLLFKHRDPMGAWEVVKRGLELRPTDMKLNLMAAQCMNMMDDKASVIIYLKAAWKNTYIGQEHIVKAVQASLFGGLDLDKAMENIKSGSSKFDRKTREGIIKVYEELKR